MIDVQGCLWAVFSHSDLWFGGVTYTDDSGAHDMLDRVRERGVRGGLGWRPRCPRACGAYIRVALAELLRSGVTTLVDLSVPHDGWLDALAESGIRACIAPMYRDARWLTRDGHSLEYEWDTRRGRSPLGTRSAARGGPALGTSRDLELERPAHRA
jgi:hypothetical protein